MTTEIKIDETTITETIKAARAYAEFADRNLIPPDSKIRQSIGEIDPTPHIAKIFYLFPFILESWETETLLALSINPLALAGIVEAGQLAGVRLDGTLRGEMLEKIAMLESDREKGRTAIRESNIWGRLSALQAEILRREFLGEAAGEGFAE